jgi:predicted ATPase/DNA-binding CsgD family transcriptional regulator
MSDFEQPLLLDPLTDRELGILTLINDGLSNPEIADQLVLGVETVRWYSKQIYSKLGVHSRTQAIRRARELGVFGDEDAVVIRPIPVTRTSNLPTYPTPFVGREEELAELTTLLRDPHVRLVTLVGPGGMGKTRLCAEVARQQESSFPGGVHYIAIPNTPSRGEFDLAMADGIGLRLNERDEPRTQVLRHLQPKNVLLLLDGFERALAHAEFVTALLKSAPQVKILVTSQVSLNLKEEWVRYLEPLTVPQAESGDGQSYGAVKLFADNVRRVRGDFSLSAHLPAVVQIVRTVQGVPLAIELAATWLKTLSAEDVAREIQQNFDFLATSQRDVEERHRSIRAVFDYSWNLLTPEEQRVFLRLSVFSGRFGFSAAEQVAGASIHILSELVGKSLLQQHANGLYQIHTLLYEYAGRKLENLDTQLLSTRSSKLQAWVSFLKGNFDRLEQVANAALASSADAASSPDKAFALNALGVLAGIEGDYARCRQLCEAGQALLQDDIIAEIFAHLGLSIAYCGEDDYCGAKIHARAALKEAASLRNPAFSLLCLPVIGIIVASEGSLLSAVELMGLAFTHPESKLDWIKKWALIRQIETDLVAELGAADYAAAWEGGKRLDVEQTVQFLLSEF